MGVACLFCCFKKQNPLCVVKTALVANVIDFAITVFFLLTEEGEIYPLSIIIFVKKILCLVLFIIILIFFMVCKDTKKMAFNLVGKILCLIIIALCFIDFIFILIGFILILKNEKDFTTKDYIDFFLIIIILICPVIMALCANYLFEVFKNIIGSSSPKFDQSTENSHIHKQ